MLTTTTVGSFPKPDYLVKARSRFRSRKLSAGELAELEKKAVAEVIRLQERLDLDILVHGEMERGDMVTYFAHLLDGFTLSGPIRSYGNRYYHKPIVKDRVSRRESIARPMFEYAQGLTEKPVKGILTGPYTLGEWSFNTCYDNRRELIMDLAGIIAQEAIELQEAGAEYIQIDEPAFSARPEDLDLAVESLGEITSRLKVKTICHLCYGDLDAMYPGLFQLPVDQFDLELANSDFVHFDLFRDDPPDCEIGLGVIDSHSRRIETVAQIKDWIMTALEVFPPEKLFIDPDCGLKTSRLSEAEEKLSVMVRAVKEIRADMGW